MKRIFLFKTKYKKKLQQILDLRLILLNSIFITLALVLIIRLAFLQCYEFTHYATLSLKNQMSIIPITPPRGIILDRNGVILAENRPVYVLEVIPEHVNDLKDSLQRLKILLPSISEDDFARFQKDRNQHRRDTPIVLKMHLNLDEVAIFSSHQYQFPGISVKARLMRYYPLKKQMAHIIGYVGRINLEELKTIDPTNYQGTNFIGKLGIEKYYENILHGTVGYEQVETNVSGKIIRVIDKQPPVSGHKIYLTLDSRLQHVAYDALKDLEGSAVLIDVKDGGVLAMVSRPSYNPNAFTKGISNQDYLKLMNSLERPLLHRAIRGLYPPASTIKPFVAIAGLEHHAVLPTFSIYDPGWFRLPNVKHNYRDWKRTGHGFTNLKRAIMVSCDTFFYTLGSKIGINNLSKTLAALGIGQRTGVDLPEEVGGLMPNPEWKKTFRKASWYPGDTIITAIGQGFTLTSPLQMAHATATLSQKGIGYQPHLLKEMIDENNHQRPFMAKQSNAVLLSDENYWAIVHEAMQAVIKSNEGTAYNKFGHNTPYEVAGKTGTAQVFSLSQNDHNQKVVVPKHLMDHSWFIAFAPVENPKVAIAVLVEHNNAAAHVARSVLDAYFQLNPEEQTT